MARTTNASTAYRCLNEASYQRPTHSALCDCTTAKPSTAERLEFHHGPDTRRATAVNGIRSPTSAECCKMGDLATSTTESGLFIDCSPGANIPLIVPHRLTPPSRPPLTRFSEREGSTTYEKTADASRASGFILQNLLMTLPLHSGASWEDELGLGCYGEHYILHGTIDLMATWEIS